MKLRDTAPVNAGVSGIGSSGRLAPESPDVPNNRETTAGGKYLKAAALCAEAMKQDPNNITVYRMVVSICNLNHLHQN
ncbi:hypothetical protein Nepgr_010301 [Nepenthes gracilis]|uniref:Uncharacterized protein n=1 Tax=Nepenthes gracilis TaxID=150966 RepID=A0AAD3XL91_NEPGR|nr:hypothetical protein Nepgr_010301 [Nepenthes gracilis]